MARIVQSASIAMQSRQHPAGRAQQNPGSQRTGAAANGGR